MQPSPPRDRRGPTFHAAMGQYHMMSPQEHWQRAELLWKFEQAESALAQVRTPDALRGPMCFHHDGDPSGGAPAKYQCLHKKHFAYDANILRWYQSKEWRKALSYDGAMRSFPGEMVHWIDDSTGMGYWDATNKIYARALAAALLYRPCGPSADLGPLNDESMGDILEGFMALAWHRPDCPWCCRRRDLIEDMVRATVALRGNLPQLSFDGGAGQWAFDVDELRIDYARRVFAMDAMD